MTLLCQYDRHSKRNSVSCKKNNLGEQEETYCAFSIYMAQYDLVLSVHELSTTITSRQVTRKIPQQGVQVRKASRMIGQAPCATLVSQACALPTASCHARSTGSK